ncbi:MAG: helix-turn-helix transcriptional regulator [Chloroflexota bacterium]
MPLLGSRLRELRARKGLSQQDLADALKVKPQQYSRWEREEVDPSSDVIARLATTLSCTADYLLGLTEQPHERREEDSLPADEQALLKMYRAGKIPRSVKRLLGDLDFLEDQSERPTVEGQSKADVPGQEKTA